jgi:hypothetical protein
MLVDRPLLTRNDQPEAFAVDGGPAVPQVIKGCSERRCQASRWILLCSV